MKSFNYSDEMNAFQALIVSMRTLRQRYSLKNPIIYVELPEILHDSFYECHEWIDRLAGCRSKLL